MRQSIQISWVSQFSGTRLTVDVPDGPHARDVDAILTRVIDETVEPMPCEEECVDLGLDSLPSDAR